MQRFVRPVRRILSVILLVIGGLYLMSEATAAWIDPRDSISFHFFILIIYLKFAAVFLALGIWASPDNRLGELGLTLIIAAGIGSFLGLIVWPIYFDPSVSQTLRPGQPVPNITLSPVMGTLNLLLFAGGGYLLRRWGKTRSLRQEPDLETIFGD